MSEVVRGTILPFKRDAKGELAFAWPQMALDMWHVAKLPGDVAKGKYNIPQATVSEDDSGDFINAKGIALGNRLAMEREYQKRVTDLAGLAMTGGIGTTAKSALVKTPRALQELMAAKTAQKLDNRSVSLYNLPEKPPRDFSADYPNWKYRNGQEIHPGEKLQYDADGRRLNAGTVVGRQHAPGIDGNFRGNEAAFPERRFDDLGKALTGRATVYEKLPRKVFGYTELNKYTRRPIGIGLSPNIPERAVLRVYAHELGHAVDQFAGEIPTAGLSRELKPLYNTLNTGQERTRNLTGPVHMGYNKSEAPREYMAEAIRAYLTDPNALKTVAPKTAAAIRKHVNSHPELNKTIQFNMGGFPFPLAQQDER